MSPIVVFTLEYVSESMWVLPVYCSSTADTSTTQLLSMHGMVWYGMAWYMLTRHLPHNSLNHTDICRQGLIYTSIAQARAFTAQ